MPAVVKVAVKSDFHIKVMEFLSILMGIKMWVDLKNKITEFFEYTKRG